MEKIIFDQNDLIKATKLILNHDLDIRKVRLKGKYGVIYVKRSPYRIQSLLTEISQIDKEFIRMVLVYKPDLKRQLIKLLKEVEDSHI